MRRRRRAHLAGFRRAWADAGVRHGRDGRQELRRTLARGGHCASNMTAPPSKHVGSFGDNACGSTPNSHKWNLQ
jgi:hypothetical protein